MGNEGPAVLLVHGFGAFWEHYRDNLKGLAAKGYRVWALTLVGFGRSEKPNITYTELTWAELVRDFIVEVVQEPVVLAGNSIGGSETIVLLHLLSLSHEISAAYLTFLNFQSWFIEHFSKVTLLLDAGFTTTVVAGLWPSLVTSLVLLNTAGKVVPDYKALTYQKVLIYPHILPLLSSTRSIGAFRRALNLSGTLLWRIMWLTKVDQEHFML